jgi:hypothetical protein
MEDDGSFSIGEPALLVVPFLLTLGTVSGENPRVSGRNVVLAFLDRFVVSRLGVTVVLVGLSIITTFRT